MLQYAPKMGIKFFAQANKSSRKSQLRIEPWNIHIHKTPMRMTVWQKGLLAFLLFQFWELITFFLDGIWLFMIFLHNKKSPWENSQWIWRRCLVFLQSYRQIKLCNSKNIILDRLTHVIIMMTLIEIIILLSPTLAIVIMASIIMQES